MLIAARETGIPFQRIAAWSNHPDNADIRLFLQSKRMEAAAEVANRLPGMVASLLDRQEKLLADPDYAWTAQRLRDAWVSIGIASDQQQKWAGAGDPGRYGSPQHTDQQPDAQSRVLQALDQG